MASKIQVKRGNKADLPILSDGEYGFCQDTSEIFIGNGGTNIKIYPTTSLDASSVTVEDIESIFESVNVEGVLSELGESILDILNGVTTVGKASDANTAGGFTVAKNVPSNAIFTDTVYTHPTTAGNKHIPTGGSVGQILKNTASGTATWQDESATTIANSLTETVTGKALDATQGKALKDLVDEHEAEKATQSEYGHIRLQDIPNPQIATQLEAETGTNNTKMMTPLRVEQAIASNVRVSGLTVEIYIDNEWVSFKRIFDISSWEDVQEIVRNGWANDYFQVGDELLSSYDGREIIWQVIGIDADTPTDSNFTHSMTIQTKDCVENGVWDSGNDNRYINSDIRAYLNGSFLNKIDPELSAVIGLVNKKVVVRNAIGGQDSFSDKVFLLSRKEADLGDEGIVTGEFIYPFYNGKGNANRIKNLDGSARLWWLRSPDVSTSTYVRRVHTDGSVDSYTADFTLGVSPACTII